MAFPTPNLTAISPTFAQFQADGASGLLTALIAAQAATSNPGTAPTLAANTDAASTLPTATYYVVVTETNGIGETTASPVSSGQAITSGTNHLTITPHTLNSGNSAWNAYVGTSATGPFTLSLSGQTGSSANITAPLPTDSYAVNPPTVNTTGLTYADSAGVVHNRKLTALKGASQPRLDSIYRNGAEAIRRFCAGDPVAFPDVIEDLRVATIAFQALANVFAEAGTLVDANPGHFAGVATGIGGMQSRRQWP